MGLTQLAAGDLEELVGWRAARLAARYLDIPGLQIKQSLELRLCCCQPLEKSNSLYLLTLKSLQLGG